MMNLATFSPDPRPSTIISSSLGLCFLSCYDTFFLLTPPQPLFLVVSHSPPNHIDTSTCEKEGELERRYFFSSLRGTEMLGFYTSFYSLALGDLCTRWVSCCSRSWHMLSTYGCGRRLVSSGGKRRDKEGIVWWTKEVGWEFSLPLGAPFLAPVLRNLLWKRSFVLVF